MEGVQEEEICRLKSGHAKEKEALQRELRSVRSTAERDLRVIP